MHYGPTDKSQPDASLEAKLRHLRQPATYPHAPKRIDAVETHMSWVFLADQYVYKLKKPVRYAFLDFSTSEARRRDCEEELRLNRRLAPDVYLAVMPLTLDADTNIRVAGKGEVVDWLVHMRRLPADCMLDYAIRHGTVTADEVHRLASRLANFYRTLQPLPMDSDAYRQRFAADIHANRTELIQPKYGMPADRVGHVATALLSFLQHRAALFDERVRAGRIVEAHGDLRPEHICLRPDPVIIDCLEFNREFRILDAADELAFLALECERLGAPDIGEAIFDTYRRATGDTPPEELVHFYKSYRALLRAKIAAWHITDAGVPDPERWTSLALEYLGLGERYIAGCSYSE